MNVIFAALVAVGLGAATLPANAGGHEWWRACGGHVYEGCGGGEHGPYARHRTYRGPVYAAPPRVRTCYWHRRTFYGPGGVYIGSRLVRVCD